METQPHTQSTDSYPVPDSYEMNPVIAAEKAYQAEYDAAITERQVTQMLGRGAIEGNAKAFNFFHKPMRSRIGQHITGNVPINGAEAVDERIQNANLATNARLRDKGVEVEVYKAHETPSNWSWIDNDIMPRVRIAKKNGEAQPISYDRESAAQLKKDVKYLPPSMVPWYWDNTKHSSK